MDIDRNWRLAVAALLLLAAISALALSDRYPMESHEIFVAETAKEMAARGDWLVPYFNGEPRLNKPPLSYWLAGLFAWLQREPVNAWHARLPSALAGVGLVGLTLLLGSRLFGRRTGLIAGLVMVGSGGFLQYTHNARPEMLYAFWCGLGIAGLVAAWQAEANLLRQRLWAHLGWFGFSLATLTKGPQLPIMLIAGFAGFLAWERIGWRRAWGILQPLSGLLLMLALCLPWWWFLRQALGGEVLAGSQLGGSLLRPSWSRIFDPYYLYRTPQLALPWLILFPVLAMVAVRRWGEDSRLRLLAFLVLVPALFLSLGPQRRWYYMLPTLMPVCLLLAAAWERVYAEPARWHGLRRWLAWALSAQWLVVPALLAGLALWVDPACCPDLRKSVLWALAMVIALGLGYRRLGPVGGEPLAAAAASTVLFVVAAGSVFAGGSGLLDTKKREPLAVAQVLAAETLPSARLATLDTAEEPFVYYTQRRILGFGDGSALRTWLQANSLGEGAGLILILRRSALPEVPAELPRRRLYNGISGIDDPLIVLALGNVADRVAP